MQIRPHEIDGVLLIEAGVLSDSRGWFMESWNRRHLKDAGVEADFVQDNVSRSRRGTVRGLHFQNPGAQGKLITVLEGEVFDVAVDIRRKSATFGKWVGTVLKGGDGRQVYYPPGVAHGFAVLSKIALFHYKCTDFYSPGTQWSIRWDDPAIGIKWPVEKPLLSDRDAQAPLLKDVPSARLFA